MAARGDPLEAVGESAIKTIPAAEQDADGGRGRRRSRSAARASAKAVRRSEGSSNLRGRSPRRAGSPLCPISRSNSPAVKVPASHVLLCSQLRHGRRDHCPSRPTSPADRRPLRPRQRTNSRGQRPGRCLGFDGRPADLLPGPLRNEVSLMLEHEPDQKAGARS